MKIRSTTAQYKKHRCVPKIASPETHESEYTAALQGHGSQEFGLCSLVRREYTTALQEEEAGGGGRGGEKERREGEERGTVLKNRTSHKW